MEIKSHSNKPYLVALFSSLLSIALHIYLAFNHYKIKFGLSDGKSLCNIGEKLNCDTVAASPYSSLFGLPMALWGASTHLVLSLFISLVLINLLEDRRLLQRISLLFSAFIALVSVIMATISISLVGNLCLFCAGTYLLSFIIVGVLLYSDTNLLKESLNSFSQDLSFVFGKFKWITITLAFIPIITFLSDRIILDSFGVKNLAPLIQESISNWNSSPKIEFNESLGLILQKEKTSSKLVLVEFADFLCPHCKTASPTLHTFTESRADVKLIFKPFPLDGTCNPAISFKGDGLRCKLAYSVFCAEKINNSGWKAHDLIFERQQLWNISQVDSDLNDLAQKLNITWNQFESCLNSNETFQAIQSMAKEGENAKIQGTPSVFANGKSLERGQFMPVLVEVYKQH